ncbi:MAG: DUF4292 domain-containing protein [Paludibacteraceae bacterium]|nr:DUF4292 domain-containing protein [Paludibacteraceae bacterium]
MRPLLLYISVIAILTSCATQRTTTARQNANHTAEVKRATLTVIANGTRHSAGATLQAVHDSIVIVSLQPLAGIEMIHIKATPDSIYVADRLNRQRTEATFNDLNKYILPHLNFNDLEQMVMGHWLKKGTVTGEKKYRAGKHHITLQITQPDIIYNQPLRIRESRSDKYQLIDWRNLIKLIQ